MTLLTSRRVLLLAASLSPLVHFTAQAQSKGATPTAGKEFTEVKPPVQTDTPTKVEVIEFFWYGCPACYAFEPVINSWRRKLGADVEYRRVPVAFDPSRSVHTKIFYALEALKKVDGLHQVVFDAIHKDRRRLLDPNEIADLMAANGVDRKQWLDAFNSFTVATRTTRAAQTWNAYKLDGTPSIGIDGRFLTSPAAAGGAERALQVAEFLIDRARSEKKK